MLFLLLSSLANASTSVNIINDSSCNLVKQKSYVVNGVTFQASPKDVPSHKSSPVIVNFNNQTADDDEYLAGVSYQIVCDGSYDGYVDVELAPYGESITTSSSHIILGDGDTDLSKIIFVDK